MKPTVRVLRLSAAVSLVSVLAAGTARGDIVTQWNEQVLASGGPQIQRTMAMVHLAMFDAINAVQPRYSPYLRLPAPPPGTDPIAAGAAAAHGILVRLFPGQAATLAAQLTASLAGASNGPGRTAGLQYGDFVAARLFQVRVDDNILEPNPPYVSTNAPGVYQLTTPGPPQPVNSGARSWVPFGLVSASQFRPGPPPDLASVRYARDLNETKEYGDLNSAVRTFDQSHSAMFHVDNFSLTRAARVEVSSDGRDLLSHARLFALLYMVNADAVTSVFDAKYAYVAWRPVTAIHHADLDGNRRTAFDPGWLPFLVTPPHPEYPAAHGTVTTAVARVLTRYFGPHHTFDATSTAVPGVSRTFASFKAFAEDAGDARVFGGMHFRTSIDVGQRQGRRVANWILSHYLQPLDGDAEDNFASEDDEDL